MRINKTIKIIASFAIMVFLYSCNANDAMTRSSRDNNYSENNSSTHYANNTDSATSYSDADLDSQLDHNQCVSNGFLDGSSEYMDCMDKLMEERHKH